MSHFNLENELNSLLRMDAPLTRGPMPRWQRKALETSISTSQNVSLNMTSGGAQQSFNKTPNKSFSLNKSVGSGNTPGKNGVLNKLTGSGKTPSKPRSKSCSQTPKTPVRGKSRSNTPGRCKTPKTPNGADRFIPNRATTQFELGYYKMTQPGDKENDSKLSPGTQEYQRAMSENLNGADIANSRIIHYANRPPLAPEGSLNSLRVVYHQSKAPPSTRKTNRYIPQVPDRILDAPEIIDDYYLNLLDWSSNNHMAVALGSSVYIWDASNGEIQQLLNLEEPGAYVCSLQWLPDDGRHLAVGDSTGSVQLWDVGQLRQLRNMAGHSARVGSLAWNLYVLSSGSRSSHIHHHDVRVAEHRVGTLSAHSQEVCGLRWSPDSRYLASGGNDNLLNVWAAAASQRHTDSSPLYTFSQHQAAVKAVSWCPWQPHVLASGGGTADRCIRFWNCSTGTNINTIDTKSQVCAILWSQEYKELISGHGFANNQLAIWKYPSMQKVVELTGHSARVLHMAISPDGTTVASAAADETLRLWKCFAVDPHKKKDAVKANKEVNSFLKQSIR